MMNREFLQTQGFEGFKTMGELMDGRRTQIPAQKGVYVALRESESAPQFLTEGTGGIFKGRNPNVSIAELKANWVEGTPVVYIGKVGGVGSSTTLLKRLGQFLHLGKRTNFESWNNDASQMVEVKTENRICRIGPEKG